eukprot:m.65225 g.65225  ORF g.65225 m.65225 type:complete len:254 (-) comp16475_c0_seq2:105-866(-)
MVFQNKALFSSNIVLGASVLTCYFIAAASSEWTLAKVQRYTAHIGVFKFCFSTWMGPNDSKCNSIDSSFMCSENFGDKALNFKDLCDNVDACGPMLVVACCFTLAGFVLSVFGTWWQVQSPRYLCMFSLSLYLLGVLSGFVCVCIWAGGVHEAQVLVSSPKEYSYGFGLAISGVLLNVMLVGPPLYTLNDLDYRARMKAEEEAAAEEDEDDDDELLQHPPLSPRSRTSFVQSISEEEDPERSPLLRRPPVPVN